MIEKTTDLIRDSSLYDPDKNSSRTWLFRTYPDEWNSDGTYANNHVPFADFAERISATAGVYAYAVHDSDVDENGDPVKPHIHWVVTWERARTFGWVKKVFEVLYALPCGNKDVQSKVRYLAHLDSPKKHQYDPACVRGTMDVEQYLSAPCTPAGVAESILDDVALLDRTGDFREFYVRHPEFLIRPFAVKTLLDQLGTRRYDERDERERRYAAECILHARLAAEQIKADVYSKVSEVVDTTTLECQRLLGEWKTFIKSQELPYMKGKHT